MLFRRSLWALVIVTVLVAGMPDAFAASIPILVDRTPLVLQTPPKLVNDRLLVPVRSFLEALGGQVDWDPSGRVTTQWRGRSVVLNIGSQFALVSGRMVTLDVPAQLIDGRTYIPLRFVGEALGAVVSYDGFSVYVTLPEPEKIVVFDGPLNIRAGPTTGSEVLTTVPVGTRLEFQQLGGDWAQVQLPGERVGWVAARYTKIAQPTLSLEKFSPILNGRTGYAEVEGSCLGQIPIINGEDYLPLKETIERLGGDFSLDDGRFRSIFSGFQVIFAPDQKVAWFNGAEIPLAVAPVSLSGQLFVPARVLASVLGLRTQRIEARRTLSLSIPFSTEIDRGVCNPVLPISSYIVMEAQTGLVLSEQRPDARVPIASTTKILTALMALEQGNPTDTITVGPHAASIQGARMGLSNGERLTLKDLLYGLILPSGNDAATAIAEYLKGTEAAFATAMTPRAAELGATNSIFYNASGLDDWVKPVSTARDLALISQYAMQNPDFRALVGAASYTASSSRGIKRLQNRNDFVLYYPGATGIKNGWTPAAGYTLVASAYRGDTELIVVLLGAYTRDLVYQTAYRLMDQGFDLEQNAWILRSAKR